VAHSAIARVSMARFERSAGETRRALAALALLEVEPSALRGVVSVSLLMAIDDAMSAAARLTPASGLAADSSNVRRDRSGRDSSDGDFTVADVSGDRHPSSARSDRIPRPAGTKEPRSIGDGTVADATDRVWDERDGLAGDRDNDGLDVRGLTPTRWGGLLYLLNLLPRIGLVEVIQRDEQWSERGLRWVLHQLAMRLAPIGPDDPAALVFAGLLPDAPPPSSIQDEPADIERAALDALHTTIAQALQRALGGDADPSVAQGQTFLDQVCSRPAQIVAEPGWIEARFSLDDVSLDIRRAGLDLDPQWVPWLGIVLRFVYA
jgi:hypothetical protein